jgi:very-short-patch-repair endonuclease
VFEIDGDSHYSDEGIVRDAVRTEYLAMRGYRVVRFTNLDLINPDGVFEWSADF